ncbi:MAG: hypothetical protein ACJ73S_21410 [Mycobacteriales bacterium]
MRLGVLDVGSNTTHLLVVDAHQGARPLPAYSHKVTLRLSELLEHGDHVSKRGEAALREAVEVALEVSEDKGVEQLVAFATSAVRDADNGDEVLRRIHEHTGVRLQALSGPDEARLTFLAVRRWFGWSCGRLLVFDIGGGSLEIAVGQDEYPDAASSLPLGAGRLTRDWFTADPPGEEEVKALRRHVRTEIAREVGPIARFGHPDKACATSKTFRSLARVAGAAPSSEGPLVQRVLTHKDTIEWVGRLATMSSTECAHLPGVSAARASQLLAGAIVADAAMDLFEVDRVEVCPWALREGVILRQLDYMNGYSAADGHRS